MKLGVTNDQTIEPANEEEEAEIREQHGSLLVRTRYSNGTTRKLHLPREDGERRCIEEYPRDIETKEVSLAVYPPGYSPICLVCVKDWRDSDA